MSETITGFATAEVLRTLMGAILQGDRTASQRWTAELLCSEKGYPKLLGVYISLAYRFFLSAGYSWVPHVRAKLRLLEEKWRTSGANLKSFRNNTEVRGTVAEWTEIWCQQQQKSSPKIPTKKEVLVIAATLKGNLKKAHSPTLHPAVTSVWKAHYDCDDLRILSNELMWAIQYHQLTRALLYFSWIWELDEERAKGNDSVFHLKRGPSHLPENASKHIGWFLCSLFQSYASQPVKSVIEDVLELWKESWLLLGKTQRKQCLGSICAWLTEATFSTNGIIKNPDQVRKFVSENEAIYTVIKNEMENYHTIKEAETERQQIVVENTDRFSMTKAQRERATVKKMEAANKQIASLLGIDFTEFEDD